jgi:hypothetical protein
VESIACFLTNSEWLKTSDGDYLKVSHWNGRRIRRRIGNQRLAAGKESPINKDTFRLTSELLSVDGG